MRWRPLTWSLLSLACFLGAFYFWRLGDEAQSKRGTSSSSAPAADATNAASRPRAGGVFETVRPASTAPLAPSTAPDPDAADTNSLRKLHLQYRLSNTPMTISQLALNDHAILLANALIDSSRSLDLAIPDSLRAKGDPGAWIVQSRGPADDLFRARLKGAGAAVISYIPNNAWLVRVSPEAARQLQSLPGIQAVIPFEPYFKLDANLLATAMENRLLAPDTLLNVVVYPDAHDAAVSALNLAGAQILGEDRSPFGPVFKVQPRDDSLAAIAGLPEVQTIGIATARKVANDLSRARVHVAADSIVSTNYLNLTGGGVLVAVNDTGVDASHPDLGSIRVLSTGPGSTTDANGHGTHVAGTIAGNGSQSATVTNAFGSLFTGVNGTNGSPGQFRGMAPAATILSIVLGSRSDFDLQQTAAQMHAPISNNGWNYGSRDYDISAASYDQAVRDSVPGANGSQPVLFVFAAGNDGLGDDNGINGLAGTILSPATAKNVITVGAIEQPRNITNDVTRYSDGFKTKPWQGMTSSSNQVASFSARGNVGIEIEGKFGRFKPDVVAPGTFVVSTRSAQFDEQAYYNPTNFISNTRFDEVVPTNTLRNYAIGVPPNAVQLIITATARDPVVDLPIYVLPGAKPTTANFLGFNSVSIPPALPLSEDTWHYSIGNPTNVPVDYDVTTTLAITNGTDYFTALSNLNYSIGEPTGPGPMGPRPYYRYESGTSMAAANVSGMLALMEQFFQGKSITNSPALIKAMVINGARDLGNGSYDFQVNKSGKNFQGWGLVNLPATLPAGVQTSPTPGGTGAPMLVFDQNPTNALATGDRRTIKFTVDPTAQGQVLRITLVWTDPPGNPSAAFKLVNNLDLIVTNEDVLNNPLVYFGNNILPGATANNAWETNGPVPPPDFVNNVENVYISPTTGVGNKYSVTVYARQVNVNAVRDHTNDVVQDYALVISSGNGGITNALKLTGNTLVTTNTRLITIVTNDFASVPGAGVSGQLLLNQKVGASSPLRGTNSIVVGTNTIWGTPGNNGRIVLGVTNQWHFYVMTNTTTFTNAAFATFLPSTLSLPQMGPTNTGQPLEATRPEADIDLFVAKNAPGSGLLNLEPAVMTASSKSLGRLGTEIITFTDAAQNDVYYIGVQSEDQQAAEYAFFGVFSELPFSQTDSNGVQHLHGINVPAMIPDGNANKAGITNVVAIALKPIVIRRVIVTNTLTHEDLGDLVGVLTHNRKFSVLNNHSLGSASQSQTYIYEDNDEHDVLGSQPSDGPGSLRNFVGETGEGIWLMNEIDNAAGHIGEINSVGITLEPQDATAGGDGTELNIQPNSFGFLSVDVPPEATNMTICVAQESVPPLPVQLFVRFGDFPTRNLFDYVKTINPPGDCLSISTTDLPPLRAGRYYIGVFNPNGIAQRVRVRITINIGLAAVPTQNYSSTLPQPLVDNAISWSSLFVTNDAKIVRAEVAVSILHPRISDLAVSLISPLGKRILLYEDRGGPDIANLGGGGYITNFFGTQTSGGFLVDTNVIGPVPTSGTLLIDHDFFPVPDQMVVFYDGALIFDSGLVSGSTAFPPIPYGPGLGTTITIVMNPTNNSNQGTAWEYTPSVVSFEPRYLVFSENTNVTQLPIKFSSPTLDHGDDFVFSDFELPVLPGEYFASNYVTGSGWFVATNQIGSGSNEFGGLVINQVSVVRDATNAQAPGDQFLALADGILTTNIAIIPRDQYILSWSYRGPGIVGWWRGEFSTNVLGAIDYASTNNGTLESVTFTTGRVDRAFSFGSASSRISIPDGPEFKLTNSLSIEGWINPTAPGGWTIFWRGDLRGGLDPYFLQVNADDGNTLQFIIEDTNAVASVETVPIAYNQWMHVAATLDGNTGLMSIYTNGVLAAQTNTIVRPFADLDPAQEPTIGIGNVGTHGFFTHPFVGDIDEISLYGRALSPSEIKAIYDAGSAGKFDRTATGETNNPAPITDSLAKAQISISGVTNRTFFGDNNTWLSRSISFASLATNVTLQVTGMEPGMLLDSFNLKRLPHEQFVLPEETLQTLVGDIAKGLWTLEIWDTREGMASPGPQLLSWQLRFILETNSTPITALFDHVPFTNSLGIQPCVFQYFYFDVPPWASFVTNRLLFASSPVNVWFNQNKPPVGNPLAGDVNFTPGGSIGPASHVLSTDTNTPPPLLVPGSRYYLAVENPCINGTNVTFAIEVDIGVRFIELTNMIPYLAGNPAVTNSNDYYFYNVSTNAARAQFEINGASGRMTLVAHNGFPPPDIGLYDYLSANPGFNDELIVVVTNSTPVALAPGNWYLTAINISGAPTTYQIMASEWPVTGRPFGVTNAGFITVTNATSTNTAFQIVWESLNGAHYYIQGIPEFGGPNWYAATHTITGGTNFTTNSFIMPSPWHYFQVVEGLSLEDVPQPVPNIVPSFYGTNGFLMSWTNSVTARYLAQWTPALPTTNWLTFTNLATSTNGFFLFLDDGTQTGGPGGMRFYQIQQIVVP